MGLGSPSLVSLAEARQKALANRKMAREGGDPLQAKRTASAVMTFEVAARDVHRLHSPIWTNAKHAAQFLTSLETYAFPRMGSVKMTDINSSHVLAVLTPLWGDKPDMARRVRQRIGMVLKWGIAKGWRLDNPAENIVKALPKRALVNVPRKALPYDKVADCLRTIRSSAR